MCQKQGTKKKTHPWMKIHAHSSKSVCIFSIYIHGIQKNMMQVGCFLYVPSNRNCQKSHSTCLWCSSSCLCAVTIAIISFHMVYGIPTVDGRNPAPSEMYKTLKIMGYLPDQLVQYFFHQFHQQYFMDQNHPALSRSSNLSFFSFWLKWLDW